MKLETKNLYRVAPDECIQNRQKECEQTEKNQSRKHGPSDVSPELTPFSATGRQERSKPDESYQNSRCTQDCTPEEARHQEQAEVSEGLTVETPVT